MASLFEDNFLNVDENPELPSDNEGDNDGDQFEHEEEGRGEVLGNSKKIETKKRTVRNPRPRLTVETLRGPRGIHTIEDYYKDIKLKGKKYEKFDLDEIMRRLQHWAHRMYPTYTFDDVLTNIERLGKKKPLQVHMSRYRLGMLDNLRLHVDGELEENDADCEKENMEDEPFDEFDALLGEQIAISKIAPRTPAQTSRSPYVAVGANNTHSSMFSNSTLATPSFNRGNAMMSTPQSKPPNVNDTSDYAQPLPATPKQLTAEQKARIAENRRIAQERLMAKRIQMQLQTELSAME